MDNGYYTAEGFYIDDELVQQCDEIRAIAKKDWFKPASVSLAKLDQVKARVYNIALTDGRNFRAVHKKPPSAPPTGSRGTAGTLSDLHAEPPLSTVSYQKAAWGSEGETSIPVAEVVRQAAGGGTRPTRPSSAKVASCTRPPLAKKSRPQSAKDALGLAGKNQTVLGVKGQRFDPADRYALDTSPQSLPGEVIGWAGPPAGLSMPSGQDGQPVGNAVPSGLGHADNESEPCPPAPNTSPEPAEKIQPIEEESCLPTEGLHLSLSLPSADVDIADEPDTGRLLEEADKYVQIQKEKEAEKIKLLQADTSSGILAGHEFQGSTEFEETHTKVNTSVDFTGDAKESSLSNNDAMRIGSETGFESPVTNAHLFADAVKISPAEDGMSAVSDTLHPSDEGEHSTFMRESDTRLSGLGESFDDSSLIESESDPTESPDKHPTGRMTEMSLPPGVEYLGPTKHEQRNRTHPLFLMRDDKPAQKLMKPHPPTDKTGKLETRPPPHHRVGVHIREDRNVTVDITPRNLGRKVADITSSKKSFINQSREDAMGRGEGRPGPLSQQRTGDTDLEVTATKVTHQSSRGTQLPSAAATVTVCYDDDSDGSSSVTGSRIKKRRRPRPLKEKDIVTMVGGMDDDDPEREVDLDLGSEGEDDSATNCSRSPSAVLMSAGEKNYYNIGRHRRPNGDGSDTEEKENIITVTTKTFEFDADKPRENVVKKILEAPLLKQRERQTPSFLEGSSSRPKSAAHGPRSPKLSVSEMHRVSPPGGKHHGSSQGGLQGRVESGDGLLEPEEEDRPLSRMGFFSEEPSPDTDNEGPKENTVSETPKVEPTHRPPSGKRRPLSATNKANRPAGTETSSIRQSRKETKENIAIKRRPSSASPSVGRNPSAVEIQRANAAVRALRSEESTNSASKSAASSRSKETRREYSSYSTAHARSQQRRAGLKSAPPSGRAVHLTSKNHLLEEEDTESLEECREIQGRLACYGIDVKAETLERALFPPSGRTLHYDLPAKLPRSYSAGLLSHPRVWLPEEHRKLKIAEKKLAMVELSLWRQKRAEERKAKLAAEKEAGENGKKKKKKKAGKKLRRSQSIC